MCKKDPSHQAKKDAAHSGDILKVDGIQQWVNTEVMLANHKRPLKVGNPSVTAWDLDQLGDELGNIWQDEKVSEINCDRILDKLTKQCNK
ncbi:MAG TPA: hypothetical protein VKF38_03770 [Anaerolineaceae bacterium]|nr:hypothetical protein [Anaerolineaceae bacterium]